jgi:hypothetical protein
MHGWRAVFQPMENARLFLRVIWLKLQVDWVEARIVLRYVQIALLKAWMALQRR